MAGESSDADKNRRNFLYIATGAMATAGAAVAVWPFIDQANPAADVLALASIEVDLSGVPVGHAITVRWRGKPVFIRHRTPDEIAEAQKVDVGTLRDPQADSARVQKPEWLVMVGVCTHLGCIPLGQKDTDPHGEFDGWFCPCHGSQYDSSGRIRKGPAPQNLEVPQYAFIDANRIRIG